MRRNKGFWAIVLIVVGVLLLFEQVGGFRINIWQFLWPVLLIAAGIWVIIGHSRGSAKLEMQRVEIPLTNVERGAFHIHHGAGKLQLGALADSGKLMAGTFRGGLDYHTRLEGSTIVVDMQVPQNGFQWFSGPWGWGPGSALDWNFGLSKQVALSLVVETGADVTELDLSALQVSELHLKTGASSTKVALPASAGNTEVRVEAGVATVEIRIPSGVAGRIHVSSGLSAINVDTGRFAHQGNVYQSADYDTAHNRADIYVDSNVGTIDIR